MKALESKMEILDIQEEYIKDELRQLQSELVRSKEEVSHILSYISVHLKLGYGNQKFT